MSPRSHPRVEPSKHCAASAASRHGSTGVVSLSVARDAHAKGPRPPSSRRSPRSGFRFRHSNPTLRTPYPLRHRPQHSGTLTNTRILAWPRPTRPNTPLYNPDFPAQILRTLTCIPDATVRRHAESAADKAYGLLLSRPHQDWLSVFDKVKEAIGRLSCATQSPGVCGGPVPQVPPSSSAGQSA